MKRAARAVRWLHAPAQRRQWRRLLVLLVLVVAWFAFRPVTVPDAIAGIDKVRHVAAFAALAYAAAMALAPGWRAGAVVAAGLVGYGGFIEVVQIFLPTRSADLADLAADAVGIVAGLVLVMLARGIEKKLHASSHWLTP